jgi:ABC-type branched-subunit amino acid transport system substrate-binding protein
MRKWRKLGLAVATPMFVMGLVAAVVGVGAGTASAASKSTILIGFNDGLTGIGLAQPVAALLKVDRGAVAYINDTGGIDGHKVVIRVTDSGNAGSGEASVNATELTQAGAVAILSGSVSNDCAAAQPIVTAAKVPDVCQFPEFGQLSPVQPYIFDGLAIESSAVLPITSFIKKETGLAHPKVAIIGDYPVGAQEMFSKLKSTASQTGLSFPYIGTMAETATSVQSYVSQALASHPDAVISEVFPNFINVEDQDLRAGGFKGPIVLTVGSAAYSNMQQLKDPKFFLSSGAAFINPSEKNPPAQLKKLFAAMTSVGAGSVSEINSADGGATSLTVTLDVLEALRACGPSCTGAQLAKKLNTFKLTFPGLVTNFGYTASSHLGYHTLSFWGWNIKDNTAVQTGPAYPAGSISLSKL